MTLHRKINIDALGAWENEGGAAHHDSMDHHYGRRIEADRSWSIYHVFTGVLAHIRGKPMEGLSHSEATRGMLGLNHRNAARRKERVRLSILDRDARETAVVSS